jgi:methyl-accepting chemotaxis protein
VKSANDTMIISKSNLENTEMVASGTEQQKALIEQILSLSGGLEDLAAELQELVKKFIL